jgi:hypothetical protein
VHAGLAKAAAAIGGLSAVACLMTWLLLLWGLRHFGRPDYGELIRLVNLPYAIAIGGFLVGLALLATWAIASLVRRRLLAGRTAGVALLFVLATFGGFLLVMPQYAHLD